MPLEAAHKNESAVAVDLKRGLCSKVRLEESKDSKKLLLISAPIKPCGEEVRLKDGFFDVAFDADIHVLKLPLFPLLGKTEALRAGAYAYISFSRDSETKTEIKKS